MDIKFNIKKIKKKVGKQTGSILFYRDDIRGLPDKLYYGDGFTVEMKKGKIYLIDIFNSEKVLQHLIKKISSKAA